MLSTIFGLRIVLMLGDPVQGVWRLTRGWPRPLPFSSCSLLCSYWLYWTANHRPGNTLSHWQCGTSLMWAALHNLAPTDYLHHTSIVFLLTFPAGCKERSLLARPLLQLRSWAQDRNGAPHSILVTLELAELDALEGDISRVETLLNEHNPRIHAGPARLLFRQLSTPDSGRLRHLEVSRLIPLIRRDFATTARKADLMGAWEQETMDLILAHERELQEEQARLRP